VLPLVTRVFRSKPPAVDQKEPGASDIVIAEQRNAVLRAKLLHDSRASPTSLSLGTY
jgi:hypothetical protein